MVPVWSQNKNELGNNSDALSILVATDKSDVTFRTGGNEPFTTKTPNEGIKLNQFYKMTIIIHEEKALLSIDDVPWANAYFLKEEIPQTGYFGFAATE